MGKYIQLSHSFDEDSVIKLHTNIGYDATLKVSLPRTSHDFFYNTGKIDVTIGSSNVYPQTSPIGATPITPIVQTSTANASNVLSNGYQVYGYPLVQSNGNDLLFSNLDNTHIRATFTSIMKFQYQIAGDLELYIQVGWFDGANRLLSF